MKRLLGALGFAVLLAGPCLAQTPKIEISAEGAFNRYYTPTGYYLDMAGWSGSANYAVRTWVAAKVEASGEYGRRALVGTTSVHDLLIGPEFFPFRHHKITPWGHFLIGEGYYRNVIPPFAGFPSQTKTDFSVTWEGGLGIDFNFKQHWAIRPIEFDYTSAKFLSTQKNQPRQSNYRVAVGVVYRIGKH
ncbi:MAG TPA: hypothetical protein VJR26_11960 [Candidatus Acidoferrales bacterium]|nr:hypothetical protein [Candidatus Acidoferrales bacterium]